MKMIAILVAKVIIQLENLKNADIVALYYARIVIKKKVLFRNEFRILLVSINVDRWGLWIWKKVSKIVIMNILLLRHIIVAVSMR